MTASILTVVPGGEMSERAALQSCVLLHARMLRLMQRAGLANVDDVERLATATDALLACDDAQYEAEKEQEKCS